MKQNKSWKTKSKQDLPLRTLIKSRTNPNTTSDDDYRSRIKPYYNSQGHIIISQKVKIQMWSSNTEPNQGSQDSDKDRKII